MSTSLETAVPNAPPSIVWARMHGFAPWPARVCCAYEVEKLKKMKNPKKPNDVAVAFLGVRNELGWITQSCVYPWAPDQVQSKFESKKFKSDKHYRASVVEAVRISVAQGGNYNQDFGNLILNAARELKEENPVFCSTCSGTKLSGELVSCGYCEEAQIHWHCFRPNDKSMLRHVWICDACCEKNNMPIGSVAINAAVVDSEKKADDASNSYWNTNEEDNMDVDAPTPSETASTTGLSGGRTSDTKKRNSTGGNGNAANRKIKSSASPGNIAGDKRSFEHNASDLVTTAVSSSSSSHHLANAATNTAVSGNNNGAQGSTPNNNQNNNNSSHTSSSGSVDDNCFVCGEDGQLLLCDYPQCTRVYHQVCVAKILPKPLPMDNRQFDEYGAYSTTSEMTWFCPKHFCSCCGVLEQFASLPLESSVKVPDYLYLTTNHPLSSSSSKMIRRCSTNISSSSSSASSSSSSTTTPIVKESTSSGLLPQKALKSCTSCPISFCFDCEEELLSQHLLVASTASVSSPCSDSQAAVYYGQLPTHVKSFFKSRKSGGVLECKLCLAPTPKIKLSKAMEGAWVRMTSTRLAIPFLRPLLPVLPTVPITSNSSVEGVVEPQDQHHPIRKVLQDYLQEYLPKCPDFLTIQEKLHALRYTSLAEYYLDYQVLANNVKMRLLSLFLERLTDNQIDTFFPEFQTILSSHQSPQQYNELLACSSLEKKLYALPEIRDLLLSLDTILEAGYTFLDGRKPIIKLMEEEVKQQLQEEQQQQQEQQEFEVKKNKKEGVTQELGIPKHKRRRMNELTALLATAPTSSTEQVTFDPMELIQWEVAYEQQVQQLLLAFYHAECHYFPTLHAHPRPSASASSSSSSSGGGSRDVSFSTTHPFLSLQTQSNNGTSPSNNVGDYPTIHFDQYDPALIFPRSLTNWAKYVQEGSMPSREYCAEYMSQESSKSFHSLLSQDGFLDKQAHRKQFIQSFLAQAQLEQQAEEEEEEAAMVDVTCRKLMEEYDQHAQVVDDPVVPAVGINTMDIANVLASFSQATTTSARGETVSMPYLPKTSLGFHNPKIAEIVTKRYQETPIEDESLLLLERLQSLTQQTLALQSRLQSTYIRRQQQLTLTTNGPVVTLGEASLLLEYKLANENLQWRLAQRQQVITTQQEVIQALQQKVLCYEQQAKLSASAGAITTAIDTTKTDGQQENQVEISVADSGTQS